MLEVNEVAVESSATIHTKAEEQRMRVCVTTFVCRYGCFMAMYLSRNIRVRCNSDALPNTVTTVFESFLMKQYVLEPSTCKITMLRAMKVGCPITPMKQSVVAKHARAILDTCMVFNWGFLFTAIITSPFNKLVMGTVIIFTIIKITVTARASVHLELTIHPSHPVMNSLPGDALEFILFRRWALLFVVLSWRWWTLVDKCD